MLMNLKKAFAPKNTRGEEVKGELEALDAERKAKVGHAPKVKASKSEAVQGQNRHARRMMNALRRTALRQQRAQIAQAIKALNSIPGVSVRISPEGVEVTKGEA